LLIEAKSNIHPFKKKYHPKSGKPVNGAAGNFNFEGFVER
jgi:hypothetical protein